MADKKPVFSGFSPSNSTRRVTPLRQFLRRRKLDGCLLASSSNISWLVGLPHTEGLLLVTEKEVTLFVNPLQQQATLRTQCLSAEVLASEKEFRQRVNACGRLGFLSEEISVARWQRWQKQFTCQLLPCPDFVLALRAVKDSSELKYLQAAKKIAREIMEETISRYLKPGVTEAELAARIRWLASCYGGAEVSFPPIVASGPNSAYPHHRPGNRKIQPGDAVIIDSGVECQGYHSDLTETVLLEPARHELKEIYSLVRQVQRACLKALRPGQRAADIHRLAVSLFKKRGMEKYFVHGLGHGVGLDVHEKPVLNGQSQDILRKGMVVTVEPGLYLPGTGGVRLEEMVFVE